MKKHSAKILTVILAASMILSSAAPSFAKTEETAPAEEVIVLESAQEEEKLPAAAAEEELVLTVAESSAEEDKDTENVLPSEEQEKEEAALPEDAEPAAEEAAEGKEVEAEATEAEAESAEEAAAEAVPEAEAPVAEIKALPAEAVAEAAAVFTAAAEEIARETGLTRNMVGLMAEPAAEEEKAAAEPFAYNGDAVNFIKADGSGFGMFTPQDGTTAVLSGDQVKITFVPKTTSVYTGFFYGDITMSDTWKDYTEMVDGKLVFTVSADKCGQAWPVAVVKPDKTSTTSAQYYLAIPAADKLEEEVVEAQPFAYDGDAVSFIKDEKKTVFGMWTAQEGTTAVLSGDTVKITYVPKNVTVYTAFYYGDITLPDRWAEKVEIADGKLEFTVSKDKCGKAWPVAIVKADGTTTTSAQNYLAIPAADKLEEEVVEAQPFDYDGDTVDFIKEDGAGFGMWAAQEGTTAVLSGDTVKITFVPKNVKVYTAFYYGDITLPNRWAEKVEIADGKLEFTVSKDKCGKAWPVAIVKADGTTTTSAQYYLAIPAEDKLEPEVDEAQPFDYDGDTVDFIKEDGSGFGMWAAQEGTTAVLSGDTVKITFVPKNVKVYTAFYYGDITLADRWTDKVEVADGKLEFTVSKDKCGKAWPVAIVKTDGTTPTSAQYYLAIPAEDKLEKEEEPAAEAIDLTITNKTGMFKVATASLVTEDGQKYLVFALNGSSYDNMFAGTFEEASANGDGSADKGNGKWLHYTMNAAGKKEFKMPVTDDMLTGENIPMVSISNSYYDGFLQGKNDLERAFFPRQFKINEEEKTLETGDYDVNEALTVTNNAKDLTVDKAELNTVGGPKSNNYAENLIVTLKETGFDKAFIGSAADAAAASETIAPAEGAFTLAMRKNKQGGIELFNYLEQNIVISFHDSASDTWKEYKVNASKENMTLTVSALAEDEEIVNPTPAPTPAPGSGTSGSTAAVDSSTGLADGNYTPDSFSFSGGTGKLNITCTNISVRNGQAYATLQFSSPNITYVKAAGGTHYTSPSGSGSVVEIPVELNKNNRILALTTAMSTPHEVEYSIFPYLAAAAGAGAEVPVNGQIGEEGKLDDKAPVIPGLTGGKEVELNYSEYLKIFSYDDGISLVEIDMTKNSVLDPEYLEKHKDEQPEEEAAVEEAEEELINEETGEKEAKPDEEYVAEQYRKDIVKYLIAPEKAELPAGLEKQLIVIRKPLENLYASSAESVEALDKLGLLDLVKTLGMKEEDIDNETLKTALKDEKLTLAGTAEKPDYKTLVQEKTGMIFITGDLLPLNEDVMKDRKLEPEETAEELTTKEYKDRLYVTTDRYATLGVPAIMDRSADEKDEKGAAEWILVYGLLFDKEEEARTVLENTLKELD